VGRVRAGAPGMVRPEADNAEDLGGLRPLF